MKVLFMGRKQVACEALQVVHSTPRTEVVGVLTDSHLEGSPTAQAARGLGIPLYTYERAEAAIADGSLAFDIGLSVLFWRRIRSPLLEHPRLGIVNFHPAPLPDFKGVGGYNLAILEGLDSWAASAHYVDDGIDTGGIIALEPVALDPEADTVVTLEKRTNKALLALFHRVWGELREANALLPSKPNEGGRHLSRAELEAMKLLDLARDDVGRKVRAFWFPPYDGAYLEIGGERFTLVDRAILDSLADPAASSLFSPRAEPNPEIDD